MFGGVYMLLQGEKIVLDDGLTLAFAENFNDVKSKYDHYNVGINEFEDYKFVHVNNVEAFGYKADLEIVYGLLKLKKVTVIFHMPSALGQKFDSREDYYGANRVFFDEVKKAIKEQTSNVEKLSFGEDENVIWFTTEVMEFNACLDRDCEHVSITIGWQ
jgi:hypothetical protein